MVAGLIALAIALPRLKKRDFLLFNIGLYFFLYGFRWLIEVPGGWRAVAVVMPDSISWLRDLLTYLIPIPFAAALLNIIGRGLYRSLYWFFIFTISYAVFAIAHDLLYSMGGINTLVYKIVLATWCMIVGINTLLLQVRNNTVIIVLKLTIYSFIICVAFDNLMSMKSLHLSFSLEHLEVLFLFAGMVYIAVKHITGSAKFPLEVPETQDKPSTD